MTARASRPGRTWGVLAILGACLSITAGNLISKSLLAHVEPLPLVFVQIAAGTAVVWAAAVATGRLPRGRAALRLALPGVFQPGLVFPLSFAGLALVPISISAFLFASETVLVLLLAWPLIAERPTWEKIAAAGTGTLGVLLISGGGTGAEAVPMVGVVLVMGGVLAAAMHTIATRAIAVDADPLPMAAASLTAGLAIVATALVVWPPASWTGVFEASVLPGIAVSGLLLHGAAMMFFNVGLARVGAGTTAILLPAIAPMSAIGGYVFFGDRLDAAQLLGAGLVLAAALAVGLLPDRRA